MGNVSPGKARLGATSLQGHLHDYRKMLHRIPEKAKEKSFSFSSIGISSACGYHEQHREKGLQLNE
jgi:hypothetical protein